MVQAAGKIHSDMQRGFIKAEITYFEDFRRAESEEEVRRQGLTHVEGREYSVQEGHCPNTVSDVKGPRKCRDPGRRGCKSGARLVDFIG